jgi:Xaa-Pro aminopeptidase
MTRWVPPVLAAFVLAVQVAAAALQSVPPANVPAYAADLQARRAAVASALGPDTALVLWSAPPRVYSTDTNYEYRQESNLLYLSGLEQPDTILVLLPGAPAGRVVAFVRAADPVRELWEGHTLTATEVTASSGITEVVAERGTDAFDAFVERLLTTSGGDPAFGTFPEAVRAGRAKLAIVAPLDGTAAADDQPHIAWARAQAARHPGVGVVSAWQVFARQRQIKTPYEQAILRRSVEISAEAHVQGMKTARPGRWEYEVEAAIEYWFHRNGALSWGYPSIVGSGPNATTLHYEQSTRRMRAGDLVLVDAAGSYQGLTGDITRTYPVSGRFSPDQRRLYELVLRAQEAGIAAARPGAEVADITRAVRRVFGAGLLELGLIADVNASSGDSAQIGLWFPHGPTHGIGMDVHEPLGRLEPGTAFVIEPGLYIRQDTLDRISADPEQAALARRIAPAVARFREMGVRIEDSFLMTPAGPEMLSSAAPRTVRAIERIVGTAR